MATPCLGSGDRPVFWDMPLHGQLVTCGGPAGHHPRESRFTVARIKEASSLINAPLHHRFAWRGGCTEAGGEHHPPSRRLPDHRLPDCHPLDHCPPDPHLPNRRQNARLPDRRLPENLLVCGLAKF
ncbi:hypothetical protein SKAU_G00284130 [Synaphobranchus kaupii]|uniref:Uncharacterized protein n=1 Tax=Synaphobranchus kaupii TaxID=118154 RepID=A0A9Q1EXM7_SYNKA|nr:hypothetical protein SKAU_G00284130 [Synaphobranchus kaupii]